jgi:hypothetical protein
MAEPSPPREEKRVAPSSRCSCPRKTETETGNRRRKRKQQSCLEKTDWLISPIRMAFSISMSRTIRNCLRNFSEREPLAIPEIKDIIYRNLK